MVLIINFTILDFGQLKETNNKYILINFKLKIVVLLK